MTTADDTPQTVAQKCTEAAERGAFAGLDAVKAKRKRRQVKLRSDWDAVRLSVMEDVVRAKFLQNPDLAARLVATGTMPLEEGNDFGDTFWGVDAKTGKGENNLGKILLKILRQRLGQPALGSSRVLREMRLEQAGRRRLGKTAGFPTSVFRQVRLEQTENRKLAAANDTASRT